MSERYRISKFDALWVTLDGEDYCGAVSSEAAKRIAAALNAQAGVVEALEGLLNCMKLAGWEDDYWAHRGRAALAAVKGETP